MQFRALLSGLVLASLCAAPSGAELRDVSYGTQADEGLVWLSFDEQPQAVTARVTETGLELTIAGVSARARDIAPFRTDLVATLQVMPQGDDGVRVALAGNQAWTGAQAEIYSGGVLVRFGLSGTREPASVVAAAGSHADGDAISRTTPGGDFATRTVASEPATAEAPEPVDHMASDSGGTASAAPHDPAAEPVGTDVAAPSRPATTTPSPSAASASAQAAAPSECSAQAAAVEESPWDDERLFAHAACLGMAGDLPRAAAIYEQMLAFEPENFRALIALAELRLEQGEDAAARDLYSQAASHAISDAEAARARARLRELREN